MASKNTQKRSTSPGKAGVDKPASGYPRTTTQLNKPMNPKAPANTKGLGPARPYQKKATTTAPMRGGMRGR